MPQTIAEIRSEYPQYADMTDMELGRALHQRFYSDIPFDQFASQVGLQQEAPQLPGRTESGAVGGVINRTGMAQAPTEVEQVPVSPVRQAFESGEIVRGAENLNQLSFRQKLINDARIMKDALIGGARGVPQGLADVGGIVANPAGEVGNLVLPGEPFSTNVSRDVDQLITDLGFPETQTRAGSGMQDLSRTATSFAAGQGATTRLFPQVASTTAPRQLPSQRQQVLQAGQREGLVTPPATVGTSRTASFIEGLGGTLRTRQLASARNQEVVNRLAARALGLADESITSQGVSHVKHTAGEAYRVIRSAGNIRADQQFSNAVSSAIKPIRNASSQSATLAQANREIMGIADDLSNARSYDADAAVDLIKMLRDRASAAFAGGEHSQGAAYRSMAGALEDVIERNLTRGGEAGRSILSAFRDARQLLAKAHTVEDALNGSNVAAQRLASMVRAGKPLTDELRTIGDFALEFPKGMQLQQVAGSSPPLSPLDLAVATSSIGGSLASGQPALLLPAIGAALRSPARSFVLSPTGQRMLTQGPLGPINAPISPVPAGLIGQRLLEDAR